MSEGGATEAFSGGAKIVALPGTDNKIHAQHLATALETAGRGIRNRSQPDAVSITQARENGTVYSVAEVAEIGRIARNEKILFHMDGARFANAVAHLQSNIADLTWRAGVDILSFGVTKNGGMNVEAIVVFNESLAETLSYRLRRSGHTWSKMRFSAAQLIAYVEDNLFLQLAATANAHAKRIEIGICDIPGVRVISAVQANLVFVEMSPQAISRLADQRVRFSRRTDTEIRLVTRYDNTLEEVDELIHRVALATAND
jgi:threonine aldolase